MADLDLDLDALELRLYRMQRGEADTRIALLAALPSLIAAARRLAEVEAERDELRQRVADIEAEAVRNPPWTDEQWRDILRKS